MPLYIHATIKINLSLKGIRTTGPGRVFEASTAFKDTDRKIM